jgi:membrane protease YdiL (CAAX protease family)
MQSDPRKPSFWLWLTLAGAAIVTIALFFIPAFIIRPFSYQAPHALEWAMALRQTAPFWTLCSALLCLVLAISIWPSADRWRRTALSITMLLVVFSAVMARVNYFELMFHPVSNLQFDPEAQSKLDSGEMVLAIRFAGDARAYPIREMAYHHVVNDVVAGIPVAVTY